MYATTTACTSIVAITTMSKKNSKASSIGCKAGNDILNKTRPNIFNMR